MDRSLGRKLLLFGILASGVIGAFGWLATRLFFTLVYGSPYSPAVGIASILMVAGSVTAFNLWASELARSGGRMWLPAAAEFPSVLVFLFVLINWRDSWGAPKAAAVGSLAGYLTTAVIFVLGLLSRRSTASLEALGDSPAD
jgi:O-antigen/teichoic acid export membrane protein